MQTPCKKNYQSSIYGVALTLVVSTFLWELFLRSIGLDGLAEASHFVLLEVLEVDEQAIGSDVQLFAQILGDRSRVLEVLLFAQAADGLDLKWWQSVRALLNQTVSFFSECAHSIRDRVTSPWNRILLPPSSSRAVESFSKAARRIHPETVKVRSKAEPIKNPCPPRLLKVLTSELIDEISESLVRFFLHFRWISPTMTFLHRLAGFDQNLTGARLLLPVFCQNFTGF